MKRICAFCFTILFLLTGFAAYGDVAYEPPETNFYSYHKQECTKVERYYYTNGTEGYVSLHQAPNNKIMQYITNAQRVKVFCTYEDWGMVTHHNNTELSTPGWVRLSELYLIYDGQSFLEDHRGDFSISDQVLALTEENPGIYIYTYPGAKEPWVFKGNEGELDFFMEYTDQEGRIWGQISYYKGIRNSWVCISDPYTIVKPFGGDPKLAQFEAREVQEEHIPLPDDDAEKESIEDTVTQDHLGIYSPEEPPARPPLDPLLPIAIGLVILAVAGAVVLIVVCYKKKQK